jgi:hypothetical protein
VIISLAEDILFVNTIPFFTSISRNIKFTTTENIPTRTASQLVKAMKDVLAIYKKRGFHVKNAMMDGEFAPLKADTLEMGVSLNITPANEHVPEIERRIRVVKERTRATRHTLPFTYIPKVMLVVMVANTTTWISAFPAKGGVSDTPSPRTVLTGERFPYKKHCRIAFGAYAQVHGEPTPSNSQFARTSGAICLGPASNLQGGYHFMHLTSEQKIMRRRWTELPMPKEVIARVDTIGKAQGQPKLRTFFNRKGQPIGDHTEYHGIPGAAPKIPGVAPETTGVELDQEEEEFIEPTQLGLDDPHPHQEQQPEPELLAEPAPEPTGMEPSEEPVRHIKEQTEVEHPHVPLRRSTRNHNPIQRLDPTLTGQRHAEVTLPVVELNPDTEPD